jgi:RNA recognition motif-containing protein
MKLFVANLPWSVDDFSLRECFEQFGTVTLARVCRNHDDQISRRFGFVEMDNDAAAGEAIRELDGSTCHGRQIHVSLAHERGSRTGRDARQSSPSVTQ